MRSRSNPREALDLLGYLNQQLDDSFFQSLTGSVLISTEEGKDKAALADNYTNKLRGELFAKAAKEVLTQAHTFYVVKDMMPVIRDSVEPLGENLEWSKELVPTRSGFLVFEDEWVAKDIGGISATFKAVLWTQGESKQGNDGVSLFFFSNVYDKRDAISQDFLRQVKETNTTVAHVGGRLQLAHVMQVPFGHTIHDVNLTDRERLASHKWDEHRSEVKTLDAVLATVFELMNQTLISTDEAELDRKIARRMKRMRLPQKVNVIQLRRIKSNNEYEGDTAVTWSHRWIVRGHWRNQPTGPGREEVKRIWIKPYIKGPDNMPLVHTEKIYSLSR